MMFQVPVVLGLLCLLAPSIAETDISSKETHQVYSYSYHIQHNGSTDPKQFLENFLPDPPEGGSAVRTFFNPHLRGFISKGYLPAGPAKRGGHSTFSRTPRLPTFEGIKNVVEQNLRSFNPPPTPEFSPLPPSIENNIINVNNDINNNLLTDNRGHNLINQVQNNFPEIPRPVIRTPIVLRPVVPPVPLPPRPAPVNDSPVPNDGVVRNTQTFEKDLPNGKVFEKIDTISYNPPPVSNFNTHTQNFDDGGSRHTHNQNQQGFGYHSTSYFRKEHRTGAPNVENIISNNFLNNELGGAGLDKPRNSIVPSNGPLTNGPPANVQRNIVPLGPLRLVIIPAVNNINRDNNGINDNNIRTLNSPPQQIVINQPKPANNNQGTGGFGVRLRRPVGQAAGQNHQPNQQSNSPPQQQGVVRNQNVIRTNPVRVQPHGPANQVNRNANQFRQQNRVQLNQNHAQGNQNHAQVNQNHAQGNQNHAQVNQNHAQVNHQQQTPVHNRNQETGQNFNAGFQNAFRNDVTILHGNPQNTGNNGFQHQSVNNNGRNNNFGYNDRTADHIINTVNEKLRHIDEEFNSISRTKPGNDGGSTFVWDDDNRDWNPFPQMEWGNRLQTNGVRRPATQNDRPFSNGHSGPNRGPPPPPPPPPPSRNNQGDTHTMDILRHTLEALVGRKLDIPTIPRDQQNDGNFHNRGGGGVEKVFVTDRVVEGPNSYSRNQQRGFERNFQTNSNTGYQRTNQWSRETARRLDTQSSRDDFRRDYIDVFAEDI